MSFARRYPPWSEWTSWGMRMKSNPVKSALRAGKFAFGTMVFEFFTPGMPQIAKTAGAEFVLFDMEHSGVTIETLKGQLAACRGIGITPMVRVPALQYHFIATEIVRSNHNDGEIPSWAFR